MDYGSVIVGQAEGRGINCSPGEYFGKHSSVRWLGWIFTNTSTSAQVFEEFGPDFYQHFGERLTIASWNVTRRALQSERDQQHRDHRNEEARGEDDDVVADDVAESQAGDGEDRNRPERLNQVGG